jgi:hypothetical protein
VETALDSQVLTLSNTTRVLSWSFESYISGGCDATWSAWIFVMYLNCFLEFWALSTSALYLLQLSCILEFDNACIGNPGKSGAGVVIWRLDGSVVRTPVLALVVLFFLQLSCLAVYCALILVLNYASKKGFKYIVQICKLLLEN